MSSIKAEFVTRYVRSRLGILWMVIQPLSMVLIYTLVLSQIMSAKLPDVGSQYGYSIYILSGIIAWNLFSDVSVRALTIFIDNGHILKKVQFPKVALPVIVVGSTSVNFFSFLLTIYVVMAFLGHFPFANIYWLPLLYLLVLLLGLGVGLIFGILNVFIRDVGQLFPILLQFGFWLTPIVYTTSIIPDKYLWVFELNPLVGLIKGFNSVLLYDAKPELSLLVYPCLFTVASMLLAVFLYIRSSKEMVDAL
ncbi:ABC transporter permease [Vibrio cholerae]|uniref:ABC transporter permease n=1 Tax=Vibrio cholerae TaxID=666 RepID=UPI00191082A2|nr:ABC transporter permease [Vibrio cholerae]MDF4533381.1 ABC transporter permease [Vibrio parahaemolyticus]EJL6275236.1 ABC transporter permease [Vibrio cholerae]EKF9247768.1 ABC transporter permease [Vibrio cholerae]EKF9477231.1 ABC transporter permease [Vibrio cholerae]ELY5208473.1 ABC transporter permease [Vibrio cholerae]